MKIDAMECTPTKESLLALINPDMHLTKGFLKRIYSFELDYPGFAEQAIAALEKAGCSRARQYYESWVAEYEAAYNAEMKKVSDWYVKECEKRERKVRKVRVEDMSSQALLKLLMNLTAGA